jgi:hypothetical protein
LLEPPGTTWVHRLATTPLEGQAIAFNCLPVLLNNSLVDQSTYETPLLVRTHLPTRVAAEVRAGTAATNRNRHGLAAAVANDHHQLGTPLEQGW